jgi:hypothetical protein
MHARIHAQVLAMAPEDDPELCKPYTAGDMLAKVIIKRLTAEVRPLKPALSVRRMTKAQQRDNGGMRVATPMELDIANQWLTFRAKCAETKALLKPRFDELKLSLKVCEQKLLPILASKTPNFVFSACVNERNPDASGNPLVRTVSARLVRREISPKSLPLTAVQAMVRKASEALADAWPEVSSPFDPSSHVDLLLEKPLDQTAAKVLRDMQMYMQEHQRVVERVCIRRARPRTLDLSSIDPYAEEDDGEEDDDDNDDEDDDDDDDKKHANGGIDEDDA